MSTKTINRTVEFKLYPNKKQERALSSWLNACCWLYNQALEYRIKAYKRRKESVSYNQQTKWLTQLRRRVSKLQVVPVEFLRSSLRGVDRSFKGFFRRVKAKEKSVGFPRFKSKTRRLSMEHLETRHNYIRSDRVYIPGLGEIRAKGQLDRPGIQKCLRVIQRADGWYAQIVLEQLIPKPFSKTNQECGIDLGLTHYLTFDSGESVENPRFLRESEHRLKRAQISLSKKKKGSNRRKKAVQSVAKLHLKVKRQRRGFCHKLTEEIVSKYDRIAVEDLQIKRMMHGKLAKSIQDASWGIFLQVLKYKAEWAGRSVVEVDPRYSSQECPSCREIVPKKLADREHLCRCGLRCDRDHAAALVIRNRAFRSGRGEIARPVETG